MLNYRVFFNHETRPGDPYLEEPGWYWQRVDCDEPPVGPYESPEFAAAAAGHDEDDD